MKSDLDSQTHKMLRTAKLYRTRCRVAILKVLINAGKPLNQEQIAQRLGAKRFNKVSIYRTLTSLLDTGLVHRAFMDAVLNWEPRVLAIGADGFFKVAIRKHPTEVCWSWALEWNHKYRIVGFFGEQEPAQTIANTFPSIKAVMLIQSPSDYMHYRFEVPLEDEEDKLFEFNGRFDC